MPLAEAMLRKSPAVYRRSGKVKGSMKVMVTRKSPDSAVMINGLLLAIAENRDKEAFRRLFDHFAPRIRGFIISKGSDREMSEDVVQETFINIWKKAYLFDPEKASASTWIFAIARNTRIDLFRKFNRPAPDFDDPAMITEPEPNAHQMIARKEDSVRLRKVVSHLPKEQQEVLRLAFFEEKAHAEVAKELGIPLGTAKSRIRLALSRMRSEFGESR
jgi:RNA polymerase sigma-70 factor (ECF subfamily)